MQHSVKTLFRLKERLFFWQNFLFIDEANEVWKNICSHSTERVNYVYQREKVEAEGQRIYEWRQIGI